MPSHPQDQQEIGALIASFAWRDQQRWRELRDTFSEDGTLSISWYDGGIDGFIEASRAMNQEGGAITKHRIDPARVVVCGDRALAETDVTIMVRAAVVGQEVDVTSYARFFDRLRHDGAAWKIQTRTGIYEKDRIDPVTPSVLFSLIHRFANYDQYPQQLKHLAYGLERKGHPLMENVVVAGGEREVALKDQALAWLAEGGCQTPALP